MTLQLGPQFDHISDMHQSHLLLLDCDDAQDGVRVLVVEGKVRERVMLVVLQLDLVAVPSDGRRGVSLDVALQVHVELQRLTKPLPRYLREKNVERFWLSRIEKTLCQVPF